MCLTHVSVRIKQCLSLLCSATRAWNFTWFIILSEIIRIIENGGVVQICYVLLFCRGEHQFILICQHCFYWIRIYNKTQNQYSEKKRNNLFQMCWKKNSMKNLIRFRAQKFDSWNWTKKEIMISIKAPSEEKDSWQFRKSVWKTASFKNYST